MTSPLCADFWAERVTYNAETGVMTWRNRPRSHFRSDKCWNHFNNVYANRSVGRETHGYLRFGLTHEGKMHNFYVHRIAYLISTGEMPEFVDHIDGNGLNNQLSNLRRATFQENLRNVPARKHNKLGVKGVRLNRHGRYVARMTIDRKSVQIGVFRTLEAARAAYNAAANAVHGQFAHQSIRSAS